MYTFIINPVSCSGRGKKYWQLLEQHLKEKNIDYCYYLSDHPGHVTEIVREITSSLKDEAEDVHLVVLGGDGTVNEAIAGICNFKKTKLSYIPTGSSNDLARDMSIDSAPLGALKHILREHHEYAMDIGKLTYTSEDGTDRERLFCVSSGIGFDAAVCKEALSSPLKRFLNRLHLGKLTYLGIGIHQLIASHFCTGELFIDGMRVMPFQRMFFTAVMSHRYEGGGFGFCPSAVHDDGLLDICVADDIPKWKIPVVLLSALAAKHNRFSGIYLYRGKEVTIRVSTPLTVHTDGEIPCQASEIHIECLPGILRFVY